MLHSRLLRTAICVGVVLTAERTASAQDDEGPRQRIATSGEAAWFGLPLPPKPGARAAVVTGTRGPRPLMLPPGDTAVPEFDGRTIRTDLEALVAIARKSESQREIGSGQLFARPENRPRSTLALVASAGHHTPGINGPRGFVAANPVLAANAILMVNLEHVAQRNFSPSRAVAPDGYREAIADSGEAPITAGWHGSLPTSSNASTRRLRRRSIHRPQRDYAERLVRRLRGVRRLPFYQVR